MSLAAPLAGSLTIAGALFASSASASLSTPKVEVASFGPVESHEGSVRGEVVQVDRVGGGQRWIVRVETAAAVPIDSVELRVRAVMPETDHAMRPAPSVTWIGNGRYEISGLRFEPAGWWNVGLSIGGARGDSLAFNLIVPQRPRGKRSGG
jgi:hypothetical protein